MERANSIIEIFNYSYDLVKKSSENDFDMKKKLADEHARNINFEYLLKDSASLFQRIKILIGIDERINKVLNNKKNIKYLFDSIQNDIKEAWRKEFVKQCLKTRNNVDILLDDINKNEVKDPSEIFDIMFSERESLYEIKTYLKTMEDASKIDLSLTMDRAFLKKILKFQKNTIYHEKNVAEFSSYLKFVEKLDLVDKISLFIGL